MIVTKEDSNLYRVEQFVGRTRTGLLQVLVAAAKKSTFNRIIDCPTYPAPVRSSGLGDAVRQLADMLSSAGAHAPTILARLYASSTTLQHRKPAGQFFTAESVASWALSVSSLRAGDNVCDAGAGTAVFAGSILKSRIRVASYTGIENEATLALCAAHALEVMGAPDSFRIWYTNFLLLNEGAFHSRDLPQPNVIIANPPFVRSHRLSGRARLLASLRAKMGITLSSHSGSVGYFLLKSAQLTVPPNGPRSKRVPIKLIFFLPKEAAGASHARRLREDLRRAHGWVWHDYDVPMRHTGVDKHQSNALALLFVFERKASPQPQLDSRPTLGTKVADLLVVRRGISTGCNDFFALSEADAKAHSIPRKYLRRVLPTRVPLPEGSFADNHWESLRASGHRCWLLALPPKPLAGFESAVQQYLREGLRRGLHATPTGLRLHSWFALPIPSEPPDVLITYLFRGAPRFVLNVARVYHLTNMLGARFVSQSLTVDAKRGILAILDESALGWINSDGAGREYRGGLMKIEPRELGQLAIRSGRPLPSGIVVARRVAEPTLFD